MPSQSQKEVTSNNHVRWRWLTSYSRNEPNIRSYNSPFSFVLLCFLAWIPLYSILIRFSLLNPFCVYLLRWFTHADDRMFIPLFADVFESLGAPFNVAKPTKDSSVAIFWLGAVGLIVSILHIANNLLVLFCFLIHIYVNLTNNDLISFGQAADGAKIASASRIICVDLNASWFQ